MSSDNYLYVTKRKGKYVVLHGFASIEYPSYDSLSCHGTFETLGEAVRAADDECSTGIVEYGYSIDKNLLDEIK